jgi:sugar (pentulose or hexulose) kinase
VSWLDGRAAPYNEELNAQLGGEWLVEHIGHGSVGLGSGQLCRLRAEAPDLLRPPAEVGFVGDVVVSRLCGRRAHDATSLSIALLLNPSLGEAEPELLARLGVAQEQLPDLLGPRTAAGELLPEVAERTGLPAGIPVSVAVHDQYAAALGCGAVHPGDVMFGAGTAWVLLAVAEETPGREKPVIPQAFACTHLVEGLWGQMLSMVNGGSAFRWAVDLLGLAGQEASAVDDMIGSTPPGSGGVRFRPLLTPGGGTGLESGGRGRLDGLSLSTTRQQVLRAVVEGLGMELRRHVGLLSDGGLRIGRLIMCGEAASSRATPPILAEATGCPLACVTEGAVSALGAAVLARGLLETEDDLASLAEQMAPPVRLCEPGEHVGLYDRMFERYVQSLPREEGA